MSKIEKALKRAGDERGNLQVVPVAPAGGRTAPWRALLGQQIEVPETIFRMAENERKLLSAAELRERGIIHPQHTEEPAVQVFRELRTKINQQSQEQNAVILVAAVSKGNGASFIARNLAAAFAFDSAKTALLVDCNLRNPSVHQLLANALLPGLTDYFENPGMDVSKIIHPVGIARFRAISTGGLREIPAEYFVSMKMRRLIDSLRERYSERFIILDGPPMSDIADARILSELSDYVLVVARHGRATNGQIESGLSAISNKKLLGIVFNDEPRIPWIR
jgi:capsular exopolysaccharide synthesis family protein